MHITVTSGIVTPYKTDDVKTLIDLIANDQTKLFVLLALNCGMLQGDIAKLQQDEVDWENGVISRHRSKLHRRAKSNKQIPKVEYPLWNETFERNRSRNCILVV